MGLLWGLGWGVAAGLVLFQTPAKDHPPPLVSLVSGLIVAALSLAGAGEAPPPLGRFFFPAQEPGPGNEPVRLREGPGWGEGGLRGFFPLETSRRPERSECRAGN